MDDRAVMTWLYHVRVCRVTRSLLNGAWPEPSESRLDVTGSVPRGMEMLGVAVMYSGDRTTAEVWIEALGDPQAPSQTIRIVAVSRDTHVTDDLQSFTHLESVTVGNRRVHVFYKLENE